MLEKMKKKHKLSKIKDLGDVKEKYNEMAQENPSSSTLASIPNIAIAIHLGKSSDRDEKKPPESSDKPSEASPARKEKKSRLP